MIEAANMTEYWRAFEVNFWGPVQVVQAMTPLLRQSKGRIINTTSASIYITIPMYSAYPTSKAALKIFTQHLRMELAPFCSSMKNAFTNTPLGVAPQVPGVRGDHLRGRGPFDQPSQLLCGQAAVTGCRHDGRCRGP